MIITLSILFILNVLDVVSTIHVANNGGVELNPIALWTMQYGNLGFILFVRFLITGRLLTLLLAITCSFLQFTI